MQTNKKSSPPIPKSLKVDSNQTHRQAQSVSQPTQKNQRKLGPIKALEAAVRVKRVRCALVLVLTSGASNRFP
jgi:hypothetical protein